MLIVDITLPGISTAGFKVVVNNMVGINMADIFKNRQIIPAINSHHHNYPTRSLQKLPIFKPKTVKFDEIKRYNFA